MARRRRSYQFAPNVPASENIPGISFPIKSQLAKLLATENISIRHDTNTPTAYFDVKNRHLVLPVWQDISEDLYDMLVVHEVGHALDTPKDRWLADVESLAEKHHGKNYNDQNTYALKQFLNIVEDARIDKRQKRRYPGSKRNYVAGYKELHDRNFFGLEGKDVNELSFIDRINIFFKNGAFHNIQFSSDEEKYVDRIGQAETWKEVVQITDELYEYCLANDQEKMEQALQSCENDVILVVSEGGSEGDQDQESNGQKRDVKILKPTDQNNDDQKGDQANGQDNSEPQKGEDENGDDKSGQGKSSESETDQKGQDESNSDSNTPSSGSGQAIIVVSEVKSITEEAASEAMKKLANPSSGTTLVNVKLPIFDHKKVTDDYKKVLADFRATYEYMLDRGLFYNGSYAYVPYTTTRKFDTQSTTPMNTQSVSQVVEFKKKESATVSFMVKEFEQKKAADAYSKIAIAKTGILNTNKLHSYKYNDDIFRKVTIVPEGKNHGFVMLLDWSGSMQSNLRETLEQLFSLVFFCKKVQIPFEVYTFRTFIGAPKIIHPATKTNLTFNDVHAGDDHGITNYTIPNNSSGVRDQLRFGLFRLRNVLSSRMNIQELHEMMGYLFMCTEFNMRCDHLNSTPLNQAILAFDGLVNEFRKKTKVQIVNSIILTDGQSDPADLSAQLRNEIMTHSYNGKSMYGVFHDPVTRMNHVINDSSNSGYNLYGTYKFTQMCLNVLKSRTNSNVVGFFLNNSSLGNLHYMMPDDLIRDPELNRKYREDGFAAFDSIGYDEFYVINTRNLKISDKPLLVSSEMSKKMILKNFTNFSNKKTVNRVLLRKFIDRINTDNRVTD